MAGKTPPKTGAAAEVIVCLPFDAVGQCLDEEAASEWIDCVRHPGLFRDDLLRAQGNRHCMFRGKRQCFVEGVCMEGLCASQYSGQSLNRNTHHVIFRLLGRERDPSRLCMEPQQPRAKNYSLKWLRIFRQAKFLFSICKRNRFEEVVVR